jgi:hypothetical protein
VEYKGWKDPRRNLRQSGASEAECDYLVRTQFRGSWEGERVELNALSRADQFVAWLEAKLAEARVEKVVPSAEVLSAAYRRASRLAAVRDAIETALAGIDGHEIDVPDGLANDVAERIAGTADAWDDALWDIVADGES